MNDGWFHCRLRARYQETDAMGVVYHANYLNWFEIGRTEWIRSVGMPYTAIESLGLMLPVLEANVRYAAPAHYDDEVIVRVRVDRFTPTRLTFVYEIARLPDGTTLVTGSTEHAWVNRAWRPTSLKRAAPELYERLAAIASGATGAGER